MSYKDLVEGAIMLCLIGLMISLTMIGSVTAIYAGDTINITLDKPYVYYSIVGNSSEVLLDIEQIGNVVFITFNKYMKDDSFEIVFFDIEKEIITQYVSSGNGGGGGGTKTITKYVNNTIEIPNYITIYEKEDNTVSPLLINESVDEIADVEKRSPLLWIIIIVVSIIIFLVIYFLTMGYSECIEVKGGKENE